MKFRKKPLIVEAIQFTGVNFSEIEYFVGGDIGKNEAGETVVATPDGAITFSIMDYIIKGVAGDFYKCDPDTFKQTYEEVKENSQSATHSSQS